MKRRIYLAALGAAVVLASAIMTGGEAQVYPVRLDEQQAERAATPPSLVLADGGLEFPDGSVQETAAIAVGAPVRKTGQTTSHAPGDDGDLRRGVSWPIPRFTDNENGTVTDNLTGLIWLDDANCFGPQTWLNAMAKAAALFDGCASCGGTNDDCGLTDDSIPGEWRLPNMMELQSLVHYGMFNVAVPDTLGTGQWSSGDPFSSVVPSDYWSSSTHATSPASKWFVSMNNGDVTRAGQGTSKYVWLVRGGP